MIMRSSLLALAAAALATALASTANADSPGPGQTTRNSSRLYYYYQPVRPAAGDISLYDLFRSGRYDTSTYLRAHPLPDGSAPSSANGSPYPSD